MPSKIFATSAGVIARMSVIEKTETTDGFIIAVSPQAAQRQLDVSLGMMGVMAAGMAALIAINGLPVQALPNSLAPEMSTTRLVMQPTFVRSATATRTTDAQGADMQDQHAPRG